MMLMFFPNRLVQIKMLKHHVTKKAFDVFGDERFIFYPSMALTYKTAAGLLKEEVILLF